MNTMLILFVIIFVIIVIFLLLKTVIKVFLVLALVFLIVLSAIYFISYQDKVSFKEFILTEITGFVTGNNDTSINSITKPILDKSLNETKNINLKNLLDT